VEDFFSVADPYCLWIKTSLKCYHNASIFWHCNAVAVFYWCLNHFDVTNFANLYTQNNCQNIGAGNCNTVWGYKEALSVFESLLINNYIPGNFGILIGRPHAGQVGVNINLCSWPMTMPHIWHIMQFCEIDLSDVVSPNSLAPFLDEIKKREKQRKRAAKKVGNKFVCCIAH
jgi:hypothetical protein